MKTTEKVFLSGLMSKEAAARLAQRGSQVMRLLTRNPLAAEGMSRSSAGRAFGNKDLFKAIIGNRRPPPPGLTVEGVPHADALFRSLPQLRRNVAGALRTMRQHRDIFGL